jgi:hypothetical protein
MHMSHETAIVARLTGLPARVPDRRFILVSLYLWVSRFPSEIRCVDVGTRPAWTLVF